MERKRILVDMHIHNTAITSLCLRASFIMGAAAAALGFKLQHGKV